MHVVITALLLAAMAAQAAPGQTTPATPTNPTTHAGCVNDPSWIAPQKPFRIYGNTWYAGPHGLGVYLITAPTGDVLIDGGVPAHVDLIEANLRSIGVRLHDIRWILNSHAHCDHAGGIAQLARDTGAEVIAGAADAPLLARGGHGDPEYGDKYPFPPVQVTRTVVDRDVLRLGTLRLTAHATPGHTRGNTTWTWTSCEDRRCLHMVDVASLSAPDYTLTANPQYPEIIGDFERSFDNVAVLPCDIPLAPHPDMVQFWQRVARRSADPTATLVDRGGCKDYADYARAAFARQLARERADGHGVQP